MNKTHVPLASSLLNPPPTPMSKRFPPNLVRDALSEVSSSKYGLDDTSSPKYPLFTVPYKEYLPNVGKFLVRSALAVVAWTVWKCHSYPSRPKPHSSAYSVFTNPSITLSDAILQYLLPLLLPVGVMMEGEEGLKEGRRKVESLSEMNWRDGVERLGLEVEKVRGEEEWRRRRGGGEEGRSGGEEGRLEGRRGDAVVTTYWHRRQRRKPWRSQWTGVSSFVTLRLTLLFSLAAFLPPALALSEPLQGNCWASAGGRPEGWAVRADCTRVVEVAAEMSRVHRKGCTVTCAEYG